MPKIPLPFFKKNPAGKKPSPEELAALQKICSYLPWLRQKAAQTHETVPDLKTPDNTESPGSYAFMHCFCDNEWFLIKNYLDYSDIFERWKCEENILQTLTYEETKALAFFLIRWDYWCSGIYDELLSGGDFIPVVERLDEFRKTFEEKK